MILVNNPGSWSHVYPPLLHSKWHGVTPTDLVFPFFMFIIGVSLFMSSAKFNHQLTKPVVQKIVRRGLTIFAIGLALNWFPFYYKSFENLRIFGVLQRIGLAYILAGLLCLGYDLKKLWQPAIILLFAYWIILLLGGGNDPYGLENNFANQIDLKLLGENHLYGGFGIPFDPEGLLATIPTAISIVFGYLMGALIKNCPDRDKLVKNMLLIGIANIFGALVWDIYFPMNKPLWTSSYVMYTGGLACLVLGFLIELIDNRGYKKWTKPFQVFGLNPLIIYVFSGVLVKTMLIILRWTNDAGETVNAYSWLWSDVFSQITPGALKFSSFLMALFHLGICYLLGYWLYKRKIIIKV